MRYTARLGVARTRAPPGRPSPTGHHLTEGSFAAAMFDTLSDRLRETLGELTGRGRVSEADVDAAMREIRLALLEADVNFKVVRTSWRGSASAPSAPRSSRASPPASRS